jgi:ABC-type uncharacterized transport system substrate-binding protein
VELRTVFMDTKRHKSEAFKKKAALEVKALIDAWRPDVVITADDNAAKYLIVPYYLGSSIPFVFCGLNWDASVYGFPAANVTGMVEVNLFPRLVRDLRPYARGDRIAVLASDTLSERKECANLKKHFGAGRDLRFVFVKTRKEWEQAFIALQDEADIVFINECQSLEGYDGREMRGFVLGHIRVPVGAIQRGMEELALVTYAKVGEEQGEYAARTALAILAGKSPADFPVVTNHKARIYLNMPLARALGIRFPVEMLAGAHLISGERKKLLYVNSYHEGYAWSDGIEAGLIKALDVRRREGGFDTSRSRVEFRVFYMDTKRHRSEAFKRRAALAAKRLIRQWLPDIVVVSGDNAVKYLLAPYFRNAGLPFVYCGVNWDASVYGLPYANTTGMVEVKPVRDTLALLRRFARGGRVGYIGADNLSNRRNAESIRKEAGVDFAAGALVTGFGQWKRQYLRLQESVDMLIWLTPAGIRDWDADEAAAFILANTRIPSGSMSDDNVAYTLLGRVAIAGEQGWWAGTTALRILDGTPPAAIPPVTNRQSRLYLNMKLARRMGIKFPMELIREATFVGEDKEEAR